MFSRVLVCFGKGLIMRVSRVVSRVIASGFFALALVLSGGIAFAVPPVVPATPPDAIPAFSLTELLGPMTVLAPTAIAALVAVLTIAGILWTIDFMWRRHRRHNR